VNWKTPRLLAQCLDSLYKDSGSDSFEIWVVDNNSGDDSLEVLSQYEKAKNVKVIANKDNVGFSKACNQVIPGASGQYVLLLNPDTFVQGDAVSTMAQFLNANPDVGAVGPKVLNPDGTLQLACRRSFPSPAASFYRLTYMSKFFPNNKEFAKYNLTYEDPDKLIEVDALSGSAMMLRKDVIDQIGLMDEDIFMYGEDIDWCWRVKEAGYKVMYLPQSVVYHYHGASSRFRPIGTTINLHKGMEVFYRKHMAKKHSPVFNVLVYSAIWARCGVFLALSTAKSLLPSSKKELAKIVPQENTRVL
jgi:GT2 family glycosyltransferase